MPEVSAELTITNRLGIHARPAAALVQRILPYQSEVFITFNGARINAKSIMGLLTLAATQGSKLVVTCSGTDADAALEAIRELIDSGFGED